MWDSGGLAWPEQHRDVDCRKLVGSDAAERTNQTVEKWEEAPVRPEAQDGALSLAHPTGCGSLLALLLLLYTPFSQREWMNATIHTIFFQAVLIPVCMFLLRELSHSLRSCSFQQLHVESYSPNNRASIYRLLGNLWRWPLIMGKIVTHNWNRQY